MTVKTVDSIGKYNTGDLNNIIILFKLSKYL